MASASDVTVVIPCYGGFSSVKAVHSVFENSAEVVTVEDGHFYYAPNPDLCMARNIGIALAKTLLILPLDADDYLLPSAVECMAAAWSPGKVVYGNWRELYSDGRTADKQAPPPEMLSRKHICHATYLFAKEDWQRVGGYDPDFSIGAEDWAFMIALVNAGCELVRLEGQPLYVKTMSDGGRTHKAIRHKEMIRQLLLEKFPDFMTRS